MSNNKQNTDIKKKILEKIQSGQVKMRPKWQFVLKAALLIIGIIFIVLVLLYLTSFTFFILRQTGIWFLPAFGLKGLGSLFVSLPWFLVLSGLMFILLLEAAARRYAFAYRRPLLFSVIVLILLVLITSFAISKIGFHQKLFMQARENHLPIAGRLYRGFGMEKFQDIHSGTIIELHKNGFIMEDRNKEMLVINITSETRFPLGIQLEPEDSVLVLGKRNNGEITAEGIRPIRRELPLSPRKNHKNGPRPILFEPNFIEE
jgi:hypothetical protein